jgi:AraC-like DNA-binding protein
MMHDEPFPVPFAELRRLCRLVTQHAPEVVLDRHRLVIHDIHPHLVVAGRPVQEHEHSYYEGHLFLEGGGVYATGREEAVGQGGTLLHGPHTPHAWHAVDAPALRLLVWFSCDPLVPMPRPAVWPTYPDLLQEVALLLRDTAEGTPGWHHRLGARLTLIVSRFLSVGNWPETPQAAAPAPNTLLTDLAQLFRDNLARPLTLSDIAAHLGMSERTLSRQCVALTGQTVMDRLQNERMTRAAALLVETDQTLETIGTLVGMPDPSYFCRRFRQHFHMTPTQYRRDVTR